MTLKQGQQKLTTPRPSYIHNKKTAADTKARKRE